jgi:hypothetical protein
VIYTILSFLPLAGAGAIIFFAQTQAKERSEQGALALTVGAGLEAAYLIGRQFVPQELLWVFSPLVHVGAAGAVVYGLILLIDAMNPKRPAPLSGPLAAHQEEGPSVFLHGFWGVFAILGVLGTGALYSPAGAAISSLAVAGALVGSVWVGRQGPLGRWVLERRPELVVWSYVHQLRVVNRQTGSSSVHWSAQVALSTGSVIQLPATSEQHAQTLVAAVFERCPGVVLGFSPENAARFKATPEAMRAGVPGIR